MFTHIMVSSITAFFVCALFISLKWRYYKSGEVFREIDNLRRYNILSRIWPCDDGFWSLKWGAARHTVFTIACSALIWHVNISWLNTVITTVSLLYALSSAYRHRVRIRDFRTAGDESKPMLTPVKSACFSVVILAWIDYIILMICYAFRP